MLEKLKAGILFHKLFKRPDIQKAYAMVKPSDSWYDTITTVHNSLAKIQTLPREVLELTSHDGLTLKGIFYPGEGDSPVTVICVHGYTSHAEREWAFPGLFYHSLGYNVLIPYQRAHGLSQGKYISFGALEHRDMMGWVSRINARFPEGKVFLHGLSMGGGIVLDLLDKPMENVKCLIADAPNTDLMAFLTGAPQWNFKKNADKIAKHHVERFRKEFSVEPSDFNGFEIARRGIYPLLLAAGSMEKLDADFARLQENNPQPTQVVILPGCNHGNGMYKQTQLFQDAICSFLKKYL